MKKKKKKLYDIGYAKYAKTLLECAKTFPLGYLSENCPFPVMHGYFLWAFFFLANLL